MVIYFRRCFASIINLFTGLMFLLDLQILIILVIGFETLPNINIVFGYTCVGIHGLCWTGMIPPQQSCVGHFTKRMRIPEVLKARTYNSIEDSMDGSDKLLPEDRSDTYFTYFHIHGKVCGDFHPQRYRNIRQRHLPKVHRTTE